MLHIQHRSYSQTSPCLRRDALNGSKLITGGMGAGRMRGVLILNCATSLIPQPSQHSLVSYKWRRCLNFQESCTTEYSYSHVLHNAVEASVPERASTDNRNWRQIVIVTQYKVTGYQWWYAHGTVFFVWIHFSWNGMAGACRSWKLRDTESRRHENPGRVTLDYCATRIQKQPPAGM